MEQRTKEWFNERKGKFTASEIHKILKPKGFGDTGESYIMQKVAEDLSDDDQEISSIEMRWGTENEPLAKEFYQKASGDKILNVGFVHILGTENQAGASPDGLIDGKNYGIEIKCPYTIVNHCKYAMIKNNSDLKEIKPEYYWQIQMQMIACQLGNWRFITFHPFFKQNYQMYVINIQKDENDCAFLMKRLYEAIELKKNILSKLK